MATASANAVQLVINVVDANSGEVISRVTKNIDSLGNVSGSAGKKAAAGFQEMGLAAANAGKLAGKGFDELGGHALTSLDNVRLLRDDLGIRIPRAMEKVIAQSAAARAAISAIGSGLVALGAVEIALHFGKEIYDFYNKLTDVTAEMGKYRAEAVAASQQKLFDTNSIEEVNVLLKQTNGLISGLQQKQAAAGVGADGSGGFTQYLKHAAVLALSGSSAVQGTSPASVRPQPNIFNADDDKMLAQFSKDKDLLDERKQSIDAKRKVDQLEAAARIDGMKLVGDAADAAAARNAKNLNLARQQQQQAETQYQHDHIAAKNLQIRQANPNANDQELFNLGVRANADVPKDLGNRDRSDADANADAELGARRTARARKAFDDVEQARAQAHAAGLQGEARFQAELQATIVGYNIQAKEIGQKAANDLIHIAEERYAKEKALRIQNEREETARLQAESAGAGLTGLAKLDAEQKAHLAELDRQKGTFSDSDTYGQRRAAIEAGSAAETRKVQDDFLEHLKQLDADRVSSSMTANQRILLDAQKHIAEMRKAYNDLYGDPSHGGRPLDDPGRLQAKAALDSSEAGTNQAANDAIAKNALALADETRKLQAEAGRGGGGNTFAERSAGINAERDAQLRAIQEREDAANHAGELDNVRQFEAQKLAIQQIANNKELDLAREQRDKLAGELRGLFSNPLEWLKRQGEEIASKGAADLLQGRLPGRGDVAGTGVFDGILGGARGGSGKSFGDLFRPTFGGKPKLPGAAQGGHYEQLPREIGSAMSVASATINVTSATINGLATGGYVPTGNGGAFNVGGPVTRGASGGRYVPTGNGGFFDIGGGSGSSGPSGEYGSPANNSSITGIGGGAGDGDFTQGGSASVQSALGTGQEVYSGGKDLAQQLGLFGKSGSSGVTGIGGGDGDGDFTQGGLASVGGGTAGGGTSALSGAAGALSGGLGVFSAFEGKGGFGGALQGALGGAKVGAEFGGPLGAAIGAGIGAVVGFIGHGARVQAQKYWFKELQPKLLAEQLSFNQGQADYQSVYDDFTSSDLEAKKRTREFGHGGESYYNDTIHPRIQQMTQQLTREARAGRAQFGLSAAQGHYGGFLTGFGSMATSDDEGWMHAQRGEFLLNQRAAMSHADVASMMNAGVSRADIGEYLGGGNGGSNTRYAPGDGGDVHLHVHTMDVKGVRDFLASYKHDIRGAVNQSYAENSGGAD